MPRMGGLLTLLAALSIGCDAGSKDQGIDIDIDTEIVLETDQETDVEVIDPPAAPTGLEGSWSSDTTAELRWTDASDNEEGFLIARSPAGGDAWVEVADVAADSTSWSESSAPGASVDYRVVAYNDGGLATSNTLLLHMPVGDQLGTITFDLSAAGVVTIVDQPANLTLSAAGPAVLDDGTITLPLTIQNDYNRPVFALKASVTDIDDVSVTADAPYTFDDKPTFHYGIAGIDVGATREADLVFSASAPPTGLVTIDLDFANHPLAIGSTSYYDGNLHLFGADGLGVSEEIDIQQFGGAGNMNPGSSSGNSAPMEGVASLDGRYAYYAVRNQPMILSVDLITLTVMAGPDLTGADNIQFDGEGLGSYGFTRTLRMSPDGEWLYVALTTNIHNYECSYQIDVEDTVDVNLIKIDRATLAVDSQVSLISGATSVQGRLGSLSADGGRITAALRVYGADYGAPTDAVHGQVFVINTSTMTLVDGAPTTDLSSFDLSEAGVIIGGTAITRDGTRAYVSLQDAEGGDLRVIDIATGAVRVTTPPFEVDSRRTRQLTVGPDGRLYWITNNGDFAVFDPASTTWTEPMVSGNYARSIEFSMDGKSYYIFDHSAETIERFKTATDTPQPSPHDNATSTMSVSGISDGHAEVVTPF